MEILTASLNCPSPRGSPWNLLKGNQQGIMVLDIEFFIDIKVTAHFVTYVLTNVTPEVDGCHNITCSARCVFPQLTGELVEGKFLK